MTSLLVNHILQTEKWTSPELFETKNRIYTFLNPRILPRFRKQIPI